MRDSSYRLLFGRKLDTLLAGGEPWVNSFGYAPYNHTWPGFPDAQEQLPGGGG